MHLDKQILRELFDAAVAAADPMRVIAPALPDRPKGRVVIIGAGKASARMGEAVEAAWGPCEGLIVTRDGYERPLTGIEVAAASHPVPDARGVKATRRICALLAGLGPDDHVIALISGGGSSLLSCPAGKITLQEEQTLSRELLVSGAPIGEMNVLRKHLSRVKGGGLAALAAPAPMLSLIISDVPGDDPGLVASGPTVPDCSTQAQAREIAARWNISLSAAQHAVLEGPRQTPAPDAACFATVRNRVVAAPSQSLDAAAALAKQNGISVRHLGDALEGEARTLAQAQAALARREQAQLAPGQQMLLLSGGECTVTRRGKGVGGPNAEFALALAIALNGAPGIAAIACDTDGVDGGAEVAGAFIDATTLARATALGHAADSYLEDNDAHRFFAALSDQVITGPTLTNVNDFRAILISSA
ncbi:hydroxypyruvate reductase [Thioclava sp. SK-1]|uniref:glycerate kinase type-2 family protein n=1 Tax=Thioclava sp. SK-1 TaxID=1889770 RepID=UPI000824FF8D|nr:glycerate kinase [Thioclava sp. SK-1]OCX65625.1 hydroxypyruvate reductase [Thioclava sp. SK-1]